MKPNLLIRTLTLSVFILLMSGFVAYQAGAFDGYLSDHASNTDTPGKDSVRPRMAPSSKVFILVEPSPETKDSSKKPQQQSNQREQAPNQSPAPEQQQSNPAPKANANGSGDNNAPKQNVYMGSSKSAPVFTPSRDSSQPK